MPANPHRGEVEFEAGGEAYKIRINMNSICVVEHEFGVSIGQAWSELVTDNVKMFDLRRFLRSVLVGEYSLEDVGELMDQVKPADLLGYLAEAIKRYRAPERKSGVNPLKASSKNAAGRNSSSSASLPG